MSWGKLAWTVIKCLGLVIQSTIHTVFQIQHPKRGRTMSENGSNASWTTKKCKQKHHYQHKFVFITNRPLSHWAIYAFWKIVQYNKCIVNCFGEVALTSHFDCIAYTEKHTPITYTCIQQSAGSVRFVNVIWKFTTQKYWGQSMGMNNTFLKNFVFFNDSTWQDWLWSLNLKANFLCLLIMVKKPILVFKRAMLI
jgi:hypothetical protein